MGEDRSRDHQTYRGSVEHATDLLRKEGFGKSEAAKIAEQSARELHTNLDRGPKK